MDTGKFIEIVQKFPQVWDRNCLTFREPNLKHQAWVQIGERMGCTATTAKDTFKGLREKYIREREKQNMFGDRYTPWLFLQNLSFLDPHIILRKLGGNDNPSPVISDYCRAKVADDSFFSQLLDNYNDFDKTLIALVKKATPIWDRKSTEYPSKQVKGQLWKDIAEILNKDVNSCMTRWKGLREKYIRQKYKYQEGDAKWHFLDEMSFLDQVIQYRKKNSNSDPCSAYRQNMLLDSALSFSHNSEDYEHHLIQDSSSSDFVVQVKNEEDVQDSSYESEVHGSKRLRSISDNSESSYEKRPRIQEESVKTPERMFGELHNSEPSYEQRPRFQEESLKSPEKMFGDLVAAMLAKKTERERNVAMIEIMQVLTK